MSGKKRGTRPKRREKRSAMGSKVVVIFGESDNDRLALKELFMALCPGVTRVSGFWGR